MLLKRITLLLSGPTRKMLSKAPKTLLKHAKKIAVAALAIAAVAGSIEGIKQLTKNARDAKFSKTDLTEHVQKLDEAHGKIVKNDEGRFVSTKDTVEPADAPETEPVPNHPSDHSEPSVDFDYEEVVIRSVVDGDTVIVVTNLGREKIRLIGVNTEESVASDEYLESSGKTNNKWGKIASEYTKSHLTFGQTVFLTRDTVETDKYGRQLAYLWTELPTSITDDNELKTKCFNARLLSDGMAESLIIDNRLYESQFYQLEKKAIDSRTGLWADEEYRSYMGLGSEVASAA